MSLLPIVIIYNVLYWFIWPPQMTLMYVAIFVVTLVSAALWFLVYRNIALQTCDVTGLTVFTLYHFSRVYASAQMVANGAAELYLVGDCLFTCYIFVILKGKRALLYALSAYALTLLIRLPFGLHLIQSKTYYVSYIIYVVILYYFQKLYIAHSKSQRWEQIATRDHLTNIANRRTIDQWIQDATEMSQKAKSTFSIVYFDIDHFKQLNDQFGHDVGDHVLIEFCRLVESHVRENDQFGRWGGDEFIIITSDEPLQETEQFIAQLRTIIQCHKFQYVSHLTASFGIAKSIPEDSPSTLLNRADESLYLAKHLGRNVVHADHTFDTYEVE